MDAYIGDSVFYNQEIFSGYNIAVSGLTSKEIYKVVEKHPRLWQCFDKVVLSSVGNDMLRSLDLTVAKSYLRKTVDLLSEGGAQKILLIELPDVDNGIASKNRDNLIHLELAKDYDNVYIVADIYRQQLQSNPLGDGVHLNDIGKSNLYDRIQDVAQRGSVYNYIVESTSNHLGADILERSGVSLEFVEYLAGNCRDWICAYEKTLDAGYTDIVGIVSSYDQQTLYENFIDI